MKVLEGFSLLCGDGLVLGADSTGCYEETGVQLHTGPQETARECSNGLGNAKVSGCQGFKCHLELPLGAGVGE